MTKALTDKTHIMILIGGDKHFLTEEESNKIKQALLRGDKYLDLGNTFIASNQFAKIVHFADWEETEKIKRGDYKCAECGTWIPRYKQCGNCTR